MSQQQFLCITVSPSSSMTWCKQEALSDPVYTIQPNRLNNRLHRVNKHSTGCQAVVHPVWQPVECLFTRRGRLFNRLSNRLNNRLDVGLHESNRLNSYNWLNNRLNVCTHDTTGCASVLLLSYSRICLRDIFAAGVRQNSPARIPSSKIRCVFRFHIGRRTWRRKPGFSFIRLHRSTN